MICGSRLIIALVNIYKRLIIALVNIYNQLLGFHFQSKSYVPADAKTTTPPVTIPALDLAPAPSSAAGDAAAAVSDSSKKDVDMRRGRREPREGGEERGRADARIRGDRSAPRGIIWYWYYVVKIVRVFFL